MICHDMSACVRHVQILSIFARKIQVPIDVNVGDGVRALKQYQLDRLGELGISSLGHFHICPWRLQPRSFFEPSRYR